MITELEVKPAPVRRRSPQKSPRPSTETPRNAGQTAPSSKRRKSSASTTPAAADNTNHELVARARRIAETEIAFIDNPCFAEPGAARKILTEEPGPTAALPAVPAGLPPYFAALYATPLLDAETEVVLFRRLNYLKYVALSKRVRLSVEQPTRRQIEDIEAVLARIHEVRNKLVQSNLRLVVSIARRLVSDVYPFDDIVGDGNLLLLRAIEKFDFSRGFKFNTYATHVIRRELNRKARVRRQQAKRVTAELNDRLHNTPDRRSAHDQTGMIWERWPRLLSLMKQILDDREQTILAMRLGLDLDQGPQNRKSIGERLGISTERVRQLELRAIARLKTAAGE
ncbi:MAG: sigma-70 family RNA polymerase sigma factor [Planctomycetes bacterium]|nr:sigma-70 family RNA polymerase sigma factor [Planctomycetota bacterium]